VTRHSHQDALDDEMFERLWSAAREFDEPFQSEASLILMAGGRLGMRAGEIAHMRESWLDRDRKQIEIPTHEPCDCGDCQDSARQSVDYRPDETNFEDQLDRRWCPKTPTSARAIPYSFSERAEATVEAFFSQYDAYPHSRTSINRRVDRLLDALGLPRDYCYPHALRATAATHHAYSGLPAAALQSLMGWSKISTANKYIRLSGGATADALHEAHSSD
jgi:integrase